MLSLMKKDFFDYSSDVDPKKIQKINFTGNLERDKHKNKTIFFVFEEASGTVLDFQQKTVKVF